MKTSPIIYAAPAVALLAQPAAAVEAQEQPVPHARVDNEYGGMMSHMADIEKRMARVREMTDQCAKGENTGEGIR